MSKLIKTLLPYGAINKTVLSYVIILIFGVFITSCSGGSILGSDKDAPPPVTTPTVNMLSPLHNSSNQSRSQSIQLEFNVAVQNVNANSIRLYKGSIDGESVAINDIVAAADNKSYTFTPSRVLDKNSIYYVVVESKITDLANNAVAATTFNFSTSDITNPTVTIVSPTNGATGVTLNPVIQLQFSEPVQNVTTTNIVLHESSATGNKVAGTVITRGANNLYTLNVHGNLKEQIMYYVVLSSDIKDMSNNAIDATNFNFTTGDFTAPTVTMLSPKDGESGIMLNPVIQLKFSEAVQNVTTHNIVLHEGSATGSVVSGTFITPGANNLYTLSVHGNLKQQTMYYVVLSSGIKDMSNNELVPVNFSFKTGVHSVVWATQVGAGGGNAYGNGISVDTDGNSYVTGYTNKGISGQIQNGSNDYFVAKYDTTGKLFWIQQVGAGNGNTYGNGISVDKAGSSYVTGYTNTGLSGQAQTGTTDYFVAKYDTNGVRLWTKQVGISGGMMIAQGICVDKSGNSYVIGERTNGAGIWDYFIAKHSESGGLLWTAHLGVSGGNTQGSAINVDESGNAYVAGFTDKALPGQIQHGNWDYFVAKYNTNGTLFWTQQVGASGGDTKANGISVDTDGNSYVTGYTTRGLSEQPSTGSIDYFVAKYDRAGIRQWIKQVGAGGGTTRANGISVDTAGNSYVTGFTDKGISGQAQNGNWDYFVAQYNTAGTNLWTKQVGVSVGNTYGYGISVDASGNSYVTGFTDKGISGQAQNGNLDYFVAKIN